MHSGENNYFDSADATIDSVYPEVTEKGDSELGLNVEMENAGTQIEERSTAVFAAHLST